MNKMQGGSRTRRGTRYVKSPKTGNRQGGPTEAYVARRSMKRATRRYAKKVANAQRRDAAIRAAKKRSPKSPLQAMVDPLSDMMANLKLAGGADNQSLWSLKAGEDVSYDCSGRSTWGAIKALGSKSGCKKIVTSTVA